MLNAENISKTYANREILKDISLNVVAGEIVSVLGESGCGKTTLLRILAGLESLSLGNYTTSLAHLAYLVQSRDLLAWRNVEDNIALGMEYRNFDKNIAQQQTDHLLERLHLTSARKLFPSQISGGMARRVALAQVLGSSPDLVLLDEPLTGLDVSGRRVVSSFLKNYVSNTPAAAVVVTHSIEEAVFMSNRIYLLSSNPARIVKCVLVDEHRQSEAFEQIISHFSGVPNLELEANA